MENQLFLRTIFCTNPLHKLFHSFFILRSISPEECTEAQKQAVLPSAIQLERGGTRIRVQLCLAPELVPLTTIPIFPGQYHQKETKDVIICEEGLGLRAQGQYALVCIIHFIDLCRFLVN